MVVTNIEVWTYLLRVHRERPPTLAIRAVTDPNFSGRILIEGAKDGTTLATVEFDILELRENASASCDDTRNTQEGVKM